MKRLESAEGVTYNRAPCAEMVEWQLKGLCNNYDPECFQPATELDARIPKRICRACPVIVQCRAWALNSHEASGVWGGLSEADRQRIWTGRKSPCPRRTVLT